MTADEATACLNLLSRKDGAPDPRSWGEQFVELNRVLRSGTALERAERLHQLYRVAAPLPQTHKMMLDKLEAAFFPALGEALGKTPKALKSTLHRGQPAFEEVAPAEEGPAAIPGATYVKPAEPPIGPQDHGTLPEMLAALRARVPEAKRAEVLEMMSEWVDRPWNSIIELGRPALEVIWAWYEPLARTQGADAVSKRIVYFRCGKHFLWVLDQFAEHPAAALLAVEAYVALDKDKKYRRTYLDALPASLRESFKQGIAARITELSDRQRAPLEEWLSGA